MDALGKVTTYCYNADTNVLEWVQYPEDTEATRTEYTYDTMYRMTHAEVSTNSGCDLSASYTYTDDLLTKLTTASTIYTFGYCEFGLNTYVAAGEYILAAYYYSAETLYMQEMWYGNLDYMEYVYDDHGRVVETKYHEDGSENVDRTIKYQYDNNGALATVYDSGTGIQTTYYYDFTDRLVKYVENGIGYSHSVGYDYDELGNLRVLTEIINGIEHTTEYVYDDDNRISHVETETCDQIYSYDDYGRLVETEYMHNNLPTASKLYYYAAGVGNESGQVTNVEWTFDDSSLNVYYEYDDNGNIIYVGFSSDSVYYECTYGYDSANQLIWEDNSYAGKTWVWTYDDAGNILKRDEYAYTTGALGEVLDTIVYTYDDNTWGDLLTTYDGAEFGYDEIGNLLYDGTWDYTWARGRQLQSMSNPEGYWDYYYDVDGMRTSRTNGTDTYTYVYNGGLLIQMTKGSNTLFFTYDTMGMPATVTHNGPEYVYVTNLQGDTLALMDADGNIVVEYVLDDWGNILSISGTMASTLGELNPLIYRGYVYDHETGLYYLQSRYYNPQIGRFINADRHTATGQGLLDSNMFAYCNNNPVNKFDPFGEDAIWLQDSNAVYGAGHTGLLLQDSSGQWWHFYWGNNRNGNKGKSGDGKMLLKYNGKTDLNSINSFYEQEYGGKYEATIYFQGNFSNAVSYAKRLSSKKYFLLGNNCMQVSTDVLRRGSFYKNDGSYDTFLLRVRAATIPNVAFTRMILFHSTVQVWHHTPWYRKHTVLNPVEAALIL